MLKLKTKNFFTVAIIFIFVLFYFKNGNIIINCVKESLFLCYSSVIPSLFIFIIFSDYISGLPAFDILSIPLRPFLSLLNIKDKKIVSYILLSALGGFAVGGYFLSEVEKIYPKEKNLLGILSILMSNNSIAFVAMAVGESFLKNYTAGIIIYIAITISSYLTAFIFSFIFPYKTVENCKTKLSSPHNLSQSISRSVISMINICGVVIAAFTVCKVLSLYIDNSVGVFLISCFTEVTTACFNSNLFWGKNLYLFCFVLAVIPLSAVLQIKSFCSANFSLRILFLSKLLHIPLSIIVLRVLANFFPNAVVTSSSFNVIALPYWNSIPLSFCLFIIAISFVIFFDKNLGIFTNLKK